MPKIVDHVARRREILQATWRVIVRDGIEGATVREIAREAGYSNGILSHYFTNKDEILVGAHQLAFESVRERADAAGGEGMAALRAALYEAFPLDETRRIEAVLDVSFWSQAMNNPALNAVRRESMENGRPWWLGMIADARARGEITTPQADELICDRLVILIDGVSVQAVLYPDDMTPARQEALLEAFLESLAP